MFLNGTTIANSNARTDYGAGTNDDIGCHHRALIHEGARVDVC